MMVSAMPSKQVSIPHMLEHSRLWFFYEGVRHSKPQKVAFLGATFLPRTAKDVLLESQTIRPAFEVMRLM